MIKDLSYEELDDLFIIANDNISCIPDINQFQYFPNL
jgi:hypothetical protein